MSHLTVKSSIKLLRNSGCARQRLASWTFPLPIRPSPTPITQVSRKSPGQNWWPTWTLPWSAALKLGPETNYISLLESVEGGATRGRYSFISLKPDILWRCNGQTAEISRDPSGMHTAYVDTALTTLESLRALVAESRIVLPDDLPPMAAGLIGYMGYDTVRLVEKYSQR